MIDKLLGTGVYCVFNKPECKFYIGSTAKRSFGTRWVAHRSELRRGEHHNKLLQADWNRLGEEAFDLVILEECSPSVCADREQHWIDKWQALDSRFGYNLSPVHRRWEHC